jgi:hypothetical protein
MNKFNCWEFMKCGRESGGINATELGICPAAKDISYNGLNGGVNGGRICWAVAGIYSKEIEGTFALKQDSCMACNFFQLVKKEEGSASFKLFKA